MLSFLSRIFGKRDEELEHPEYAYRVHADADAIHCQYREEPEQSVRWVDLREIRIITTNEGPMLPDVFWRFAGATGEVEFPQMAIGEPAVTDRAMKLSGFDHEQCLAAMRSAENAEFVVWKRK